MLSSGRPCGVRLRRRPREALGRQRRRQPPRTPRRRQRRRMSRSWPRFPVRAGARAPSPESAARERATRAAIDVIARRSSSAGPVLSRSEEDEKIAREVDQHLRDLQLREGVAPTGASSLRGSSRFRSARAPGRRSVKFHSMPEEPEQPKEEAPEAQPMKAEPAEVGGA
eukprot:1063067-Alexandrium_andersonii.AAC.1